jgi:hypothetical protein
MKLKVLSFALMVLSSLPLLASVATNTSVIDTSSESVFERVRKNTTLLYFGMVNGPSARRPIENRRMDQKTGELNGRYLSVGHQMGLGYKVGDYTLIYNHRFETGMDPNDHVAMQNARPGIQGTWARGDRWAFWARWDVELPQSKASRADKMQPSPGFLTDLAYSINDLSLVGFMTYFRAVIYDSKTVALEEQKMNSFIWLFGYYSYRLTDITDFTVAMNYEAVGTANRDDWSVFRSDASFVNIGSNIDVSKNWRIFPHLTIPTDTSVANSKNYRLEMWLMGKFF